MKEKENKHVVGFRTEKLQQGEEIQQFLDGWIGQVIGSGDNKQQNGMFILTNKRACFYRKGLFGEVLQTIPIEKITSVETISMMGHRTLKIHTSHDDLSFKTFEEKPLFDKVYDRIEYLRQEHGGKSVEGIVIDHLDQLKKLSELRDSGVITEAEFASKKSEILSRL